MENIKLAIESAQTALGIEFGSTRIKAVLIDEENKPIAEAILLALANGSMTSPDLAKTIGQNTQKTNGVAGEMVKLGMLDKFKVKVKGKGEQTQYTLVTTPIEE